MLFQSTPNKRVERKRIKDNSTHASARKSPMSIAFVLLAGSLAMTFKTTAFAHSIDIFYGYFDQRPNAQVEDHREAKYFMDESSRPCVRSGQRFCSLDWSYAAPFEGVRRLPSGETLRVRLWTSSFTANDDVNRTRFALEQKAKSERIEQAFLSRLAGGADEVIYLGHARYGGGPDFSPPELLPDGSVNAPDYRDRQKGFRDMLNALAQASRHAKKPLRVALLACDSEDHFGRHLRAQHPDIDWVLVRGALTPRQLSQRLLAQSSVHRPRETRE